MCKTVCKTVCILFLPLNFNVGHYGRHIKDLKRQTQYFSDVKKEHIKKSYINASTMVKNGSYFSPFTVINLKIYLSKNLM